MADKSDEMIFVPRDSSSLKHEFVLGPYPTKGDCSHVHSGVYCNA
jgi:hypothetical protein